MWIITQVFIIRRTLILNKNLVKNIYKITFKFYNFSLAYFLGTKHLFARDYVDGLE